MQLLVLAAIIGAPISALAYGFLKLVDELQSAFFTSLPKDLGFDTAPAWWPLPLLVVAGVRGAISAFRHRRARLRTGSTRGRHGADRLPASCSPRSGP